MLENLRDNIHGTERRMSVIQESLTQWLAANEMKDDLASWLKVKQQEVEQIAARPVKLHVAPAEAEVAQLQVSRRF